MKDNNIWITQAIKTSSKHKSSLQAFTEYSNDTKADVHF
jgi:hypothetical protein